MLEIIKKPLRKTFIYDIVNYLREEEILRNWKQHGKPIPPPHVLKQRVVKGYAKRYSCNILVETGTYIGEMVYATRKNFKKIYSIELDENLHKQASEKFFGFNNITLIQGDSGRVLQEILLKINEPCLFWLDGHYSGEGTARGAIDTPIIQELTCIFNHPVDGHVIIIDDIHCFNGEDGYPTIEEMQKFVGNWHSEWVFEVEDNIFRIHKDK